ncbi:MAG: cell wall hydrolase, partial [Paraclostridium sp.]
MKKSAIIIFMLLLGYFIIQPTNIFAASEVYGKTIKYEVESKTEDNKSDEPKEVISITNDELFLLSKLVASEARGESYEGQIAVAAVVINRVMDPRFPNTIEGVIYQKNAFSVVGNGQIYMDPTDTAYKAAREALYGEDPTNGAIFFWNPDI